MCIRVKICRAKLLIGTKLSEKCPVSAIVVIINLEKSNCPCAITPKKVARFFKLQLGKRKRAFVLFLLLFSFHLSTFFLSSFRSPL
jgi:hypothetical protein